VIDRLNRALAGRYLVERELGRGGMATVWLASDLRAQQPVALKVLHPALAGAIGADRFTREVKLTATLHHPSIVPVLETGIIASEDGDPPLPWYAMPFIEGESLRARLDRDGALPLDDALRITDAVAGALETAHAHGIVHRDIKPENVLLQGDRVYVVDFGIGKALVETGGERLTSTGIAIGTPAYMSPEQASAEAADARSDQYSLATMLYEMLVGEPPFTGPTAQAVVARRFAEPARPIRTVRSAIPEGVERAVLRARERAPVDRYPDVAGFVRDLRRTSGTIRSTRRRPRIVSALILLVVVLVGVAVAWQWRSAPASRGTPSARDSLAVALYRRGLRSYDTRRPAGTLDAVAAFGEAVRQDSSYSQAWTGLAKAYVRSYERAFRIPGVTPDSVLRLAIFAVERAEATGPENADTWLTRAIVSRQIDPTDRTLPLRAARRAVALDSTNATAWHYLALDLMETGDVNGALRSWHRSVAADPAYTQGIAFLGIAYYWVRSYDSAMAWTDSAIAVDPNYLLGWSYVGQVELERGNRARASAGFAAATRLAAEVERVNNMAGTAEVEARAGRRERARTLLRDVDSLASTYDPVPVHTAVFLAEAHAAAGDADRAMEWLHRYSPSGDLHFQLHLRCDPSLDPIARDERFLALLVLERPPPPRGCGAESLRSRALRH
jgi:serine/threonine protein kinase/cytochrome c-type biogenesis protein CcmH/NrfG